MGQFVHQSHLRMAFQKSIEVHFFEDDAAVLDAPPRHLFEIADLRCRVGAAMRFDDADDHVHALFFQALPLLQHLVGLTDAGSEAEIDLQPPALLLADQFQKTLRRRPILHPSLSSIKKSEPQRPRDTEKNTYEIKIEKISNELYKRVFIHCSFSSLCLCDSVVSSS